MFQILDSGKCFWILGSVLDSGKYFWILGSVFGFREVVLDSEKCLGFWEVFWILGSVLSPWATVFPSKNKKHQFLPTTR